VLLIFLVLLCVFMFLLPRCDICYDFRIKIMVSLSLPSVVYRMAHVSFTLFVFVSVEWCSTQIVLGFLFCLSLSCIVCIQCC
jgi:hypothetical protein